MVAACAGLVVSGLYRVAASLAREWVTAWLHAPETPKAVMARRRLLQVCGVALAILAIDSARDNWGALTDVMGRAAAVMETSRGFRSILGFVVGLGLAELVEIWHDARTARKAGTGAPAGPGWTSPAALLPIMLLLLGLYAVVSPRGELNLAFLQSLKTPFGEAEFARAKAELQFQLVNEPQGFFPLNRDGLGEALHMARAELHRLEAMAASPVWAADEDHRRQLHDMRNAMRFIATVLQPMALCLAQVDSLYGDPKILESDTATIGRGLTQAMLFARSTGDKTRAARQAFDAIATMIDGLEDARNRHAALLAHSAGPGSAFTVNLCDVTAHHLNAAMLMPRYGTGVRFEGEDLRRALVHPATVHAVATFFLWSGNFRAAQRVVAGDAALRAASPDFDAYPGIVFVKGFAERWLGAQGQDPKRYLDPWDRALAMLDRRLGDMARYLPAVIEGCRDRTEQVVTVDAGSVPLMPEHYVAALHADRPPLSCGIVAVDGGSSDPEHCAAQLSHGYFAYFAGKIRNHIIHETAREVLADRTRPDIDQMLLRARRHRSEQLQFIAQGGLGRGHCHTLQEWQPTASGPDVGAMLVTTTDAGRDHALFKSSMGLLRMAEAVQSGADDDLSAAVRLFDETLGSGAFADDDIVAQTTMRYRAQARAALNLD